MGATRAILLTSTTYGAWMRGDRRGWVDDGVICPPDPEVEAADRARMKHPPFRFDRANLLDVGVMIGESLVSRLNLTLLAMTVQTWHVHVVIPATPHDVSDVVKCLKDAVRYGLRIGQPIWTDGFDTRFCFDDITAANRVLYVLRHNEAMGWGLIPTMWARFINAREPI